MLKTASVLPALLVAWPVCYTSTVTCRHGDAAMKSYRFAALVWGMAAGLMPAAWAAEVPATQLGFSRPVAAAMNGIDSERIRAHVRFLADDLLEGRGTGARGGDIAALYIATQFALDGLKPAGITAPICKRWISRECR